VVGLAVSLLGNAATDVVADAWVQDHLEHLRFPKEYRGVLPVLKSLAAAGLLLGTRNPRLGRFTARALVAYFVLAVGYHVRARDRPVDLAPALVLLGWSALAVRAAPPARLESHP
jgi:hypothetical protein